MVCQTSFGWSERGGAREALPFIRESVHPFELRGIGKKRSTDFGWGGSAAYVDTHPELACCHGRPHTPFSGRVRDSVGSFLPQKTTPHYGMLESRAPITRITQTTGCPQKHNDDPGSERNILRIRPLMRDVGVEWFSYVVRGVSNIWHCS